MRTRLLATALSIALLAPRLTAAQGGKADSTVISSNRGMVVSVHYLASDIGTDVLARGGNAIDAAVATAFALAVTHPSAGNIGGGGFMIVRTPNGRVTAFDYRERSPIRSTRDMYLGSDGQIVRELTNTGYLAPGVPGTVRGIELAHKRF